MAKREQRKITGFLATLTPEQLKAALEYRGPENLGDPDFPKRRLKDRPSRESRPSPRAPR